MIKLYKAYGNGSLNFNKKKKKYFERDLQEPNLVEGHRVFFGVKLLKPFELNYFGYFQNNYYSSTSTEY